MKRAVLTLKFFRKDIIRVVVFLSLILILGYGIGVAAGNVFIRSFITGKSRLLLLLFRPSSGFIKSIAMLNSSNELERLTGYYSMLYNDKIDMDYLMERYKMETSVHLKRTIIWLTGYSRDTGRMVDEFTVLYNGADPVVKKEILRTLHRRETGLLQKFIKANEVKPEMLKDL